MSRRTNCVRGVRRIEPQRHGAQRDRIAIGDNPRPPGDTFGDAFEKREIWLLIQQIGINDHAEHGTDPEDKTRGLIFRSGVWCHAAHQGERRLVADTRELDSRISTG